MRFTKLLGLVVALSITGCAITRYYKTGDIEGQINQLYAAIDGNVARLEADYAAKRIFLEGAKKTGADPTKPPYDGLTADFVEMGKLRDASVRDGATARAEALRLAKAIGGKPRVTSDDPAYTEIGKFEKRSDELTKMLNESFGRYTEKSNQFSKLANESRVFPVDVPAFSTQLRTAITEIDRQCGEVGRKIGEVEGTLKKTNMPKREERLGLIEGMKGDVVKIRASQGELVTFEKSFLGIARGQKTIVVGPHLPHHEFFMSLADVQTRVGASVASFNGKVDAFNRL